MFKVKVNKLLCSPLCHRGLIHWLWHQYQILEHQFESWMFHFWESCLLTQLRTEPKMVQMNGSLPPIWETQMEFWAHDISLDQLQQLLHWGLNQCKNINLSLSFPLPIPVKLINKNEIEREKKKKEKTRDERNWGEGNRGEGKTGEGKNLVQ